MGGVSERGKEIKRRRHRRKKLQMMSRKLQNANASERAAIGEKIRRLTPGADVILHNWELAAASR